MQARARFRVTRVKRFGRVAGSRDHVSAAAEVGVRHEHGVEPAAERLAGRAHRVPARRLEHEIALQLVDHTRGVVDPLAIELRRSAPGAPAAATQGGDTRREGS